MKCILEEITPSYLAKFRRRQPYGPCYLGRWSTRVICAFDEAQELDCYGKSVARLLLIDSPFTVGFEKLPPRLYDFFSTIGMYGAKEAKSPPQWLILYFLTFVDSLDEHSAKPFAPGWGPKTHVVYAKGKVCKHQGDPRPEPMGNDPREMNWLLDNRTDFGPNGWVGLLGGGEVVIEVLESANHFTLMEDEKIVESLRFVENVLA